LIFGLVVDEQARAELTLDLDELFREGARRMLAVALEAEVEAYITAHAELVDEGGHRLVVRNGHAPGRTLATGVGQVEVVRPRVDDRRTDPATGQRQQFQSVILPRWCRRSPKVAEVLPLLYLHGLSSMDFVPAMERFFGAAAGLSASVITRLAAQWQGEREAFLRRSLADRDYMYCWADGIHFNIRLEEGRLCCLVLVGVRADGTKELVAVADGQRESSDAWAELLRDLRRRGMRAPVVMVGDGALGLWRALSEVFPATREQRCWVHRSRKESTWCFRRQCVLLTVHEVQQRCRGGESSSGRGDGVAVLFQQRADVQERVADGARTDGEQVGQDTPGADSALGQDGCQDSLGVGDLLPEDASSGPGKPLATPSLVPAPFGLGGLPEGEPFGQLLEFLAAYAGQCRVGQHLGQAWSADGDAVVEVVQQVVWVGEAEHGRGDRMSVLLQQPPGRRDRLADRGRVDLEHLRHDLLGAHLPQVDDGDQDPVDVTEQRAAAGARSSAATSAALLVAALFGLGGLRRCQAGRQRVQLLAAHAGQRWVGEDFQGL